MALQHLGTMLTDQSSVVQTGVQTLYRCRARNTVPFPNYPAGCEHSKDCRKMQIVAKVECKAIGRLCSGQQVENLAHHRAHHIDLWPLEL